MTKFQRIFRLAKQLMDKGMTAKEALVLAKEKVDHHPTKEQFGAARKMRERMKKAVVP